MTIKRRCLTVGAAIFFTLGLAVPATAPTALAAATCVTHNIAVGAGGGAFGEAPPPAGHNWEPVDYFPRGGVLQVPTVHNGDCLDFKWDGDFHTVSFFSTADSPTTHPWTTKPLAIPDADTGDTGEGLVVNPAAFGPSNPACGSSATNACAVDGSTFTNAGANPIGTPDWFAQLNVGTFTGNLWFFCLVHPGMAAYVTVVPAGTPVTTPTQEQAAAQAQYTADLAEAQAAETAASGAVTTTTNSDGTHTVHAIGGAASAHVELDEFFPGGPATAGCPSFAPQCWKGTLTVKAGDKVTLTYTGVKNIHTYTFPQGNGSNSVDPFQPAVCEVTGSHTVDTPAPNPGGPPPFGCTTGAPESPFFAANNGVTAIAGNTTVATSGLIGPPPSGLPQAYTYSFPNANSGLAFQCRIHDNMIGVVVVQAAAVAPAATATPALPAAGAKMDRLPGPSTPGALLAVLGILALVAVAGAFSLARLRAD